MYVLFIALKSWPPFKGIPKLGIVKKCFGFNLTFKYKYSLKTSGIYSIFVSICLLLYAHFFLSKFKQKINLLFSA